MIINVFCTASQLLWKQGCKLLQDIFKYLIVAQQRVHSTWSGFPVYSFCGFHVWPVKNNIFGCCYWIDVFWWKWSVIAYSMLGIALLSYLSPVGIFVPHRCRLCLPSIWSAVVACDQPVVSTKCQEETQSPYYPKNPPRQGCSSHPHNSGLYPALKYDSS